MADLLFIVAKTDKGRFQVSTQHATLDDRDVIVRCVQGHSGHVWGEMENSLAHTKILHVRDAPILFHATKTERLNISLVLVAPG